MHRCTACVQPTSRSRAQAAVAVTWHVSLSLARMNLGSREFLQRHVLIPGGLATPMSPIFLQLLQKRVDGTSARGTTYLRERWIVDGRRHHPEMSVLILITTSRCASGQS